MRAWMNLFENSLTDVLKLADELGVHLSIDDSEEGILFLDDITRGNAPKGSGALVMSALVDYADVAQKRIELVAADNSPKLIDYYKGFGFEPTGSTSETGTVMIRD